MSASAIVVTHNSAPEIETCLSALARTGISLCVVDNASTDETVNIVRRVAPDAVIVGNYVNLGFAAAVNQALLCVEHSEVLLVNPDCVLPESTAWAMLDTLSADPTLGIVGPQLVDARGRLVVSAHPFETVSRLIVSRFGGSLVPLSVKRKIARLNGLRKSRPPDSDGVLIDVDWLSGACLAVRMDLLKGIGGLDDGYFMYYEDVELCWQAREAGLRVAQISGAEALHLGGASSRDPAHLWPHLYRSLLRYHRLRNPQSYSIVRAVVFARAVLGLVFAGLRVVRGQVPEGRRRAQAWWRVAGLTLRSADPQSVECE